MKALRAAAALHNLREQPLWRLLAATKAPAVLALLHALFEEREKPLASSVLHERLARELEPLRQAGEELPQTAQTYVADWLAQGWLVRRFPAGASEEEYELSADAAGALRYVMGLLQPRVTATESRLSLVIQQLAQLADATDPNPASRIASLEAERGRIDRAIDDIAQKGVRLLPDERALERAREIIALAQELTADFRTVRDRFERLNRELRQSLLETEGSRSAVLEQLFAGMDLIADSDEGRTFYAFWRLLTDAEQSATLVESLDEVTDRPFARSLEARERKFLLQLTRALLREGGGVHDVLQNFAKSLRSFVQSREFQEQRRMNALLREATQAALAVRDDVRTNAAVGYTLNLTSSNIRSVGQWHLYDPQLRLADSSMAEGAKLEIDLESVAELVRQSEIDFGELKAHVRAVLVERTQATVGDVLNRFPARQGLGSIVGLVALGVRHGEVTATREAVHWLGRDGAARGAWIPSIYFVRERLHELDG
jgi:hypothetical protein